MKNIISLALSISLCVSAFAQKSISEKVKSNYLKLPSINLEEYNPETFQYYFTSSEVQLQDPKMAKVKAMCVPKGGGLDDIIEVQTNYYQIPATVNQSILAVYSDEGEVVFAEKISGATKNIEFGKGKCENWFPAALKKNYEQSKGTFLPEQSSIFLNEQKELGKQFIRENVFSSLIFEDFKVYSGKGKIHNYEDLELASKKAISGYDSFRSSGFTVEGANELRAAIKIWEKALKELNEEDKKARINKSIGKGLYENLGRAYSYLYQDAKAIDSYKKSIDLWGGFSNNRRIRVEEELQMFQDRITNNQINKSLIADDAKLAALASTTNSNRDIQFEQEELKTITQLNTDYQAYLEKREGETLAGMKSSTGSKEGFNIYEGMIVSTTNAEVLSLNPMVVMMMEEKPEGFPIEICDLTQLNVLTISRLGVDEIPEKIGNLTQLRNLNLSGNNIKTISAGIGNLTALKKLNLSGNPIESFSSEIQNCTSLNKLILKGSNLSADQKKELKRLLPNTKIKY